MVLPRSLHAKRLPDTLGVKPELPRHHSLDLAFPHQPQDRLVPPLGVALQALVGNVGGTRGLVPCAVDRPLPKGHQHREYVPHVLHLRPRVLHPDAHEPAPALGRLDRPAAASSVPVRRRPIEVKHQVRRRFPQRRVLPPPRPRPPVDHLIRAQRGGEVHGAGDRQDVAGTKLALEELQEEAPHAPARVDHDHAVPGPDVLLERVGGQAARRDRGGVGHGHRVGHLGAELGRREAKLGQRVKRPRLREQAGDAIAHPEPRLLGVDLGHDPARVPARDVGEARRRLHERGLAAQHPHVPRGHRHGARPDEERPRPRHRGLGVLRVDPERAEVLVARDGARLHLCLALTLHPGHSCAPRLPPPPVLALCVYYNADPATLSLKSQILESNKAKGGTT
mmetsp:Transcript_37638/g.94358  ORF Transcript_37638/g.94358 Transcript_37638/m.94358 type:complete len:394 (-) Transcript_37638:64-1245(-)